MPEPNEDRVRRELDVAATRIDIGNSATGLEAIHADARRRRLRRTGLTALGVVAVAAAGIGALLVTGDPEADRISGADPTTTSPAPATTSSTPTTTSPAATTTTSSGRTNVPVTTVPGATGDGDPADASVSVPPPRVVQADAGTAVEVPGLLGQSPAATGNGWTDWLVPWRGGFLAATTEVIQPRPEPLSEELQSRFPQEVNDLFPDGLPPTLNEAQQILAEAGLLDEVTEIVSNDPELYDALYAATP